MVHGQKNIKQRPLPDNTQLSQETSMPLVGFEPPIPIKHTKDRAATGIGKHYTYWHYSATVSVQTVWRYVKYFQFLETLLCVYVKTPNYTTLGCPFTTGLISRIFGFKSNRRQTSTI